MMSRLLCRVSQLHSNNPGILNWTISTTNQTMFMEANLRLEYIPNLRLESSTRKKVKVDPAQNLKSHFTLRLCPVTKSPMKWLKWLKNFKTIGIFGHSVDKRKIDTLNTKRKTSRTLLGLTKMSMESYQEDTNRLLNILSSTLWNPVKPS